jgi:RimJ/RimL family protein N-acetyltransferase
MAQASDTSEAGSWLTRQPPKTIRAREAQMAAQCAAELAQASAAAEALVQQAKAAERKIDTQKILNDSRLTITDGNLILRPLITPDDIQKSATLHFDIERGLTDQDRHWINMNSPEQLEDIHQATFDSARYLTRLPDLKMALFYAHNMAISYGIWKDSEMVGVISFYKHDDLAKQLFNQADENSIKSTVVLTAVIQASERNRGYGRLAKQLLLDYLFHTLHAVKVVEIADAENTVALDFIQKLGFVPFKSPTVAIADTSQLLFFELSREDFDKQAAAAASK